MDRVNDMLEEETGVPYTLNHYYMDTVNNLRTRLLQDKELLGNGCTVAELEEKISSAITPQKGPPPKFIAATPQTPGALVINGSYQVAEAAYVELPVYESNDTQAVRDMQVRASVISS